jgi:hypothetical protein
MFYLNLSKKTDITSSQTFKFVQRTITLGKDVSNNLRLYSPDASVSSIHAEIYTDRDNFFIINRGGGSGTYIENMKLMQNRSYLLKEGTQINIGEYILTFFLNSPDTDIEKPEKISVKNTINYLDDALAYLNEVRENNPDVYDKIIRKNLRKVLDIDENSKLRSLLLQKVDPDNNVPIKDSETKSDKSEFIIDMFLKLFVEFHSMSIQIFNEFIDSHTVHRRDSKQLVFPDSLKNYILNTELSADEKEKRIKFLWNEIEELISKHIALFAGYKNSIKYGTRDLLKELDPVSIIDSEQKKSEYVKSARILYKYLPFLMKRRNIKCIIDKYESLSKNIDKEIELKYFQPAFKSGYLQKVNSDHRSEYDLTHLKL